MRVFSEMDRFHMAKEAAGLVLDEEAKAFISKMDETLEYHHNYIKEHGSDISEVENWKWEDLTK